MGSAVQVSDLRIGQAKLFWRKMGDLSGNLCRESAGIETGNTTQARLSGYAGLPGSFFPNTVGGNHSKSCNDNSARGRQKCVAHFSLLLWLHHVLPCASRSQEHFDEGSNNFILRIHKETFPAINNVITCAVG